MLNRDELQRLRNQICLNSLYIHDYENNMGIDAKVCSDFFDGFMSYISELFYEDHPNATDKHYWDEIWNYDTIENLENWYGCFEEDPLPITKKLEEVC